jgi:hypothetical protein
MVQNFPMQNFLGTMYEWDKFLDTHTVHTQLEVTMRRTVTSNCPNSNDVSDKIT